MQCNTLNIKTTAKQVWLYFIPRTTRPRYAGTTTNLQIVLNTPQTSQLKSPLKSSRTKKYLPNFPTQKNPVIENSKPKNIFQSPPSIEIQIQSTPPPPWMFVTALFQGIALEWRDPPRANAWSGAYAKI